METDALECSAGFYYCLKKNPKHEHWIFLEAKSLKRKVRVGDEITGQDFGFTFSKLKYRIRRITKEKIWMVKA